MKLCHIFKTGYHTDSQGNKRYWSIEDLNKIVKQFETVHKDAPICIGHPKSSTPAYGWIDKVVRKGDNLYCTFKNVQKEFWEACKKGLFKNRSISLDKDFNIRHLAFLGAQAPAIKGLEQFCFSDDENYLCFDFSDYSDIELSQRKEKRVEEKKLQGLLDEKNSEIESLKKSLEEMKKSQKIKEFEDFCDAAIKEGNILPRHRESVINILLACDDTKTFNFEDGEEKNAVEVAKNFVKSLKIMNFEEVAIDGNDKKRGGGDAQSIAKKIQKIMKEKGLGEAEAYGFITK